MPVLQSLLQPDLQATPDVVGNFSGERSIKFRGLRTAMGMGVPGKPEAASRMGGHISLLPKMSGKGM